MMTADVYTWTESRREKWQSGHQHCYCKADGIHFTVGATGTCILYFFVLNLSVSTPASCFVVVYCVCLSGFVTKSAVLFGIPAPKSEGGCTSSCISLHCVCVSLHCLCSYKLTSLLYACVCVCFVFFYLFSSTFCTHLFHAGCPFTPLPAFHTICESVSLGPSVWVRIYGLITVVTSWWLLLDRCHLWVTWRTIASMYALLNSHLEKWTALNCKWFHITLQ